MAGRGSKASKSISFFGAEGAIDGAVVNAGNAENPEDVLAEGADGAVCVTGVFEKAKDEDDE